MMKLVCCLMLSAAALFADVTGKWSGTGSGVGPDGENHQMTLDLELKQTGQDVTGTVSTDETADRFTVAGTMDGDVLTLKVSAHDLDYTLTLNVKDDKMTGDATAESGQAKIKIKLEFKRNS